MKLYYSPGACSMIVRAVLLETGQGFEAIRLDLNGGEQHSPAFLALNPKGKVPTLVRDDGSVLTELGTILGWLAETSPEHGLLPESLEARTRVQEIVEYCISTVHTLGTSRIFAPASFGDAEKAELIRTKGGLILDDALVIIAERLSAPFVAETLSIADFVLFWIAWGAIFTGRTLPPAVRRHYSAMLERPAIQQSLAAEGFARASASALPDRT